MSDSINNENASTQHAETPALDALQTANLESIGADILATVVAQLDLCNGQHPSPADLLAISRDAVIVFTFRGCRYNQTETARELKMNRGTLRAHLCRLGLLAKYGASIPSTQKRKSKFAF